MKESVYFDNIIKYNNLENRKPDNIESDEDIISFLESNSLEKNRIKIMQDDFLDNELSLYEKHQIELDNEHYEALFALAVSLSKPTEELDSEIALRIHRILLEKALKINDIEKIIEEIYWCGLNTWKYKLFFRDDYYDYFSDIIDYVDAFDNLNDKGRIYFLKCYGNRILKYTEGDPKVLFEIGNDIINFFDAVEKKYPSIDYNFSAARLTIYSNMCLCYGRFQRDEYYTEENAEKAYQYACKVLELIGYSENTNVPMTSYYLINYYACKFFAKKYSIDDFLADVDRLSTYDDNLSKRENCRRVISNNFIYIAYIKRYLVKTHEEVYKIVENKIDYVIEFTKKFEKNEISYFTDRYLLSFISACSTSLPYNVMKDIVMDITVNRDVAMYVHSNMVKELTIILFDYIYNNDIDKLVGIGDNFSIEYLKNNKEEIYQTVADAALLHDIGKYEVLSIVSNASRKLENEEFGFIKDHPERGYSIVENTNASNIVKDGIYRHHCYHDLKGGYPLGLSPTNNQIIVDIISIADSIDSATDNVGRSYKKCKTLSELLVEFDASRDTRYSGYIVELLHNKDIFNRIESILKKDRVEFTCKIYRELKCNN